MFQSVGKGQLGSGTYFFGVGQGVAVAQRHARSLVSAAARAFEKGELELLLLGFTEKLVQTLEQPLLRRHGDAMVLHLEEAEFGAGLFDMLNDSLLISRALGVEIRTQVHEG